MRGLHIGRIGRVAMAALGAVVLLTAYVRFGPLPQDLFDDAGAQSTMVVDRTGAVLYESLSNDGTRAIALDAAQLPPVLIAATLAAEDRRFWSHLGIDPIAMARAVRSNLAERRVVEGGSTISQQAAKLLLNRKAPDRVRSFGAKIDEAVLAVRLEHRFSKHEILALYLNHAHYGNQIVGVERASRAYFGVPSTMLTAAQAAFLAALPQRPTRFNPYKNRELAIMRQRTVLARMAAAGALSAQELQHARDEHLTFAPSARPFAAPHLVEMVLAATPEPRPQRIETTLDLALQRDVAGIIDARREDLRRHGAANVAVVVLDNASGEWLAWEGSGGYEDAAHGGKFNGPVVPRQPGSTLKPFTYALAFEHDFTPASVLNDAPTHFPTADPAVLYTPRNYDGGHRGPLRAREALGLSQNIPAVVLAAEVGVPALLRTLSRAGLSTLDKSAAHYGLGITLGNAEVRLDELVAAYAAFARGGMWIAPTYLRTDAARDRRMVFSPQTAFWITDILSDADAREAVFGRGSDLEFPFVVAAKTGTSQAYHDNWTIGYSRHVTVGVWVGNFNRTPLRNSSGVTGAAPIFHSVMLAAERRVAGTDDFSTTPILAPPANLQSVTICALSGRRANQWCPLRKTEWLNANDPSHTCDSHRPSNADDTSSSPTFDVRPSPARTAFAIANPPDGATYLIDPTLRREFQSLPLRAVSAAAGAIEWFVNEKRAGATKPGEALDWPLATGTHRVKARDAAGRTVVSTIHVR